MLRKRLHAIVFVSLLHLNVTAQISYLSSNYAAIGDSVHLSQMSTGLNSFNFDTTGGNFQWDYSGLSLASQSDLKHTDPSNSGYKNAWCLSKALLLGCNTQYANFTNLAEQGLDSLSTGGVTFKNIVHHYELKTDVLTYKMFGATIQKGDLPITLPISYDNPDSLLQFPISYQDKDSNTFAYQIDLTGYGISFKNVVTGKRVNEVEGWGTLVTPYKTYQNVLKVKTWVYKSDSLYTAQGSTGKVDTLLSYSWYDPTVTVPVLRAEGQIVAGKKVITKVAYQDSLRCITPSGLFTYSPLVPYYDTTSFSSDISFGNLSGSAQSYFWDFGDGSSSTAVNPSHTFKCPGTQIVKLIATNHICNPTQSDTVIIPIYVVDSTHQFQKTSFLQICEGDSALILGSYRDSTGIYSQTYQSRNGCDSTITVNLNVIQHNKNITKVLGTLTSNQTGAAYQWVDCASGNVLIPGETSISYSPGMNGDFAVLITKEGCTAQSECKSIIITGIEDVDRLIAGLYPNPTRNHLTLQLKSQGSYRAELVDIQGRVLKVWDLNLKSTQLDLSNVSAGEYFLMIQDAKGQMSATLKVIKQ